MFLSVLLLLLFLWLFYFVISILRSLIQNLCLSLFPAKLFPPFPQPLELINCYKAFLWFLVNNNANMFMQQFAVLIMFLCWSWIHALLESGRLQDLALWCEGRSGKNFHFLFCLDEGCCLHFESLLHKSVAYGLQRAMHSFFIGAKRTSLPAVTMSPNRITEWKDARSGWAPICRTGLQYALQEKASVPSLLDVFNNINWSQLLLVITIKLSQTKEKVKFSCQADYSHLAQFHVDSDKKFLTLKSTSCYKVSKSQEESWSVS